MAGTMLAMLGSLSHYISVYHYAYSSSKIMPKVITVCLESDNEFRGKVQNLGCHLERTIKGDSSRTPGDWDEGWFAPHKAGEIYSKKKSQPRV